MGLSWEWNEILYSWERGTWHTAYDLKIVAINLYPFVSLPI